MNICENLKTIRTIYADLNGNGSKEKIILTGTPLEKDDTYMTSLQLIIDSEFSEKKMFNLEDSGSEFDVFSVNVTPLKGQEILLIGNYNKEGYFGTIKILRYEDKSIKLIFDSENFSKNIKYSMRYLDDYNIEITCDNTNEKYILDIDNIQKNYIVNEYGQYLENSNYRNDIIYTIDNVFPVKLEDNDYYSLMIQQGFRLKDTTDKLGGIQTLIDINTLDDIAIIDQYLIKMS